MATTEENFRAFLLADTAIAAVVGQRVNYNHVPQSKDPPYIFYQQSGANDDGALGDSPGTPNRPVYAIECWAELPEQAITLKNLVQGKIHKYRGAFGAAGSTVQGIFAADVSDEYEFNGDGGDSGLCGVALFAEVVL
jgi:hypothetical protein